MHSSGLSTSAAKSAPPPHSGCPKEILKFSCNSGSVPSRRLDIIFSNHATLQLLASLLNAGCEENANRTGQSAHPPLFRETLTAHSVRITMADLPMLMTLAPEEEEEGWGALGPGWGDLEAS